MYDTSPTDMSCPMSEMHQEIGGRCIRRYGEDASGDESKIRHRGHKKPPYLMMYKIGRQQIEDTQVDILSLRDIPFEHPRTTHVSG